MRNKSVQSEQHLVDRLNRKSVRIESPIYWTEKKAYRLNQGVII